MRATVRKMSCLEERNSIFMLKGSQMLVGVHIYKVRGFIGDYMLHSIFRKGKRDQEAPDGTGSIQLEEQKIWEARKRQL